MATRVKSGRPFAARPTGTVTFLFSDIEGSTSRWEADPDAMASALARHDALMRANLEPCGYVFKTIGDAFCAAFARAQDALTAALDAQRSLIREDFSAVGGLRVRMALHTGTADERDDDYFGPAVNRVARLLAIGHGGQVLLSGAAAELLQGVLPAETGLRDLGAHRLKDLARPLEVYQLVAPDLLETFPPLRSLDELPNNLPRRLSSFVGRDDVMHEIAALIEKSSLVTLIGTGGAGKTRCAIQLGAELLDGSGDGVWLAELAPISDPALVPNVIAEALNLQGQPNKSMLDALLAYLKRKRLLLIVDNCEHVIDEARTVIAAILRDCPEVRVLATSREPLNIAGEATYRVPSLAVPAIAEALPADAAARYGAVQLFVDRALWSDNRFALTEQNAQPVAEICRRLDGIPLAIELAAARVKVLSPQQLAAKLDERFRLLTGGDRSALPRQQTMRALIDWSYDLLLDAERSLFRQLSIFAGEFTLQRAAAVCAGETVDELAVLDLLASLVDKSLVQADTVDDVTRYRLLESTRQYAREKLEEAGERGAIALAHARAFAEVAEQMRSTWAATPERRWYALAEAELEDFRAALAWAFAPHGDVLLAQQLVCSMRGVWTGISMAEGRRWVQIAQDAVSDATPVRLRALLDQVESEVLSALVQNKASVAPAERALARFRELGDAHKITEIEDRLGTSLIYIGRLDEGVPLLERALADARSQGRERIACNILRALADARAFSGEPDTARQLFGEALSSARAAGAERAEALIAVNFAEAEFRAGNTERALQLAQEGLIASQALKDGRNAAQALCNVAAYLVVLERYDEARTAARMALAAGHDVQYDVQIAFTLQHISAVGALQPGENEKKREQAMRAARVLGYVDARLVALDAMREYTEQREYDAMLPALHAALGAERVSDLLREGDALSEEQAVSEAMLI